MHWGFINRLTTESFKGTGMGSVFCLLANGINDTLAVSFAPTSYGVFFFVVAKNRLLTTRA